MIVTDNILSDLISDEPFRRDPWRTKTEYGMKKRRDALFGSGDEQVEAVR